MTVGALADNISPSDTVTLVGRTLLSDGGNAQPDSIRIMVYRAGSQVYDTWFNSSDAECYSTDNALVFFDAFSDIDGTGGDGHYTVEVGAYGGGEDIYTYWYYDFTIGGLDVNVSSVDADAIEAGDFDTGAIDADALATDAVNEIEDAVHANANDYKADVSGLSTFDASSDSVMTKNPNAYKADVSGLSTFDATSDSVMTKNPNAYKADVSGLSTFDHTTDKVTLVDSSAGDISYIANNQDDYKATTSDLTGLTVNIKASDTIAVVTSVDDKTGYTLADTSNLTGLSVVVSDKTGFTLADTTNLTGLTVNIKDSDTIAVVTTIDDKTDYALTTAEKQAIGGLAKDSVWFAEWPDTVSKILSDSLHRYLALLAESTYSYFTYSTREDVFKATSVNVSSASTDAFDSTDFKIGFWHYIADYSDSGATGGGGGSNDSLQIRRWVWDSDSTKYGNYGRNIDNGGGLDSTETAQAVRGGMTTQGYTTTRAIYLDYLDEKISSRTSQFFSDTMRSKIDSILISTGYEDVSIQTKIGDYSGIGLSTIKNHIDDEVGNLDGMQGFSIQDIFNYQIYNYTTFDSSFGYYAKTSGDTGFWFDPSDPEDTIYSLVLVVDTVHNSEAPTIDYQKIVDSTWLADLSSGAREIDSITGGIRIGSMSITGSNGANGSFYVNNTTGPGVKFSSTSMGDAGLLLYNSQTNGIGMEVYGVSDDIKADISGYVTARDTLTNGDTIAVMPEHWTSADSSAYQGEAAGLDSAEVYQACLDVFFADSATVDTGDGSFAHAVSKSATGIDSTKAYEASLAALQADSATVDTGSTNWWGNSIAGSTPQKWDATDSSTFKGLVADTVKKVILKDTTHSLYADPNGYVTANLTSGAVTSIWDASGKKVDSVTAGINVNSIIADSIRVTSSSSDAVVLQSNATGGRGLFIRGVGTNGIALQLDGVTADLSAQLYLDSADFHSSYYNKVDSMLKANRYARVDEDTTINIGYDGTITATANLPDSLFDTLTVIHQDVEDLSLSGGGSEPETVVVGYMHEAIFYPIQGARITVRTIDGTTVKVPGLTTDVNGRRILELDPDSFYVALTANNYVQKIDTLIVESGGGKDTLYMSPFDPGEPTDTANQCREYIYTDNILGDTLVGAVMKAVPVGRGNWVSSDGRIVIPKEAWTYTDSSGYAYLDLYKSHKVTNADGDSLKYNIMVYKPGYPKLYKIRNYIVPDSTSHWLKER